MREDVLILSHARSPCLKTRSAVLSHHFHQSDPRVAFRPQRSADDDADGAEVDGGEREEQAQAMDADGADRVADGVAEERVLVVGVLTGSCSGRAPGIDRRQDHAAVQRQREARREEERDRDHVRRIVVEVAVLVAGVRHPIEMADDAVREAVGPRAHQARAG